MTITEIAQKAGVSIGTVDRVLHNRGHVADATRQKIQAIIEEYDYTPNQIASQLKRGTAFTVGVLLPPLTHGYGYWKAMFSGIQDGINKLKPFQITIESESFDRSVAGSLYENGRKLLGRAKLDALVLAPLVPDEATRLLSEADLPFVFIDSPLPSTTPLSVIVQNPYNGGKTAARIMTLLKGNGKFASIRMFASAYNLRERSRGFNEYFMNNTQVAVIDAICPDETAEGVFSFMEDLFALHPEINGIFVTHTEAFLFGQYLSYTGRKSDVALIGYDLLDDNRQALAQGRIDCIISQRPDYQGQAAINEVCRSLVLAQNKPNEIHVPIDILFAENATEYTRPESSGGLTA